LRSTRLATGKTRRTRVLRTFIATLRPVEAVRVADVNPAGDEPPAAAALRPFAEDELVVAAARLATDGIVVAVSRLAQGELDVADVRLAQDGPALEVAAGTSADAAYSDVRLSPVATRDARAALYPGAHQAFRAAWRRDVLAVQCRVAPAVQFRDDQAGRCRGDLADRGGPAERRDGQGGRRPDGLAARHREAACRADPVGASLAEVRATRVD